MHLEIVQIVNEFSTLGGIERVAWELAHAWDRAGIPNYVLTRSPALAAKGIHRIVPWLSKFPNRDFSLSRPAHHRPDLYRCRNPQAGALS